MVEALAWQSRPYQTAADLRLMQTLSSACWRADWPAPLGHPGDLDWWSRDEVPGSLPLSERAQLWFAGEVDASDLVAWAWFNLPSDFELMIRPDMRVAGLVRAIVDWAGRRAVTVVDDGVPVEAVQASATDAQPDVVGALRGLGFEAVEDHLLAHLTRRFEGWPIAAAGLPAGFELRLLGTEADVASRVACGRAAFPSSRMTVEKYDVARRSTLYRPALDWLVIAPDGAVAGFALGWLDPVTLGLELEPVGIHPAYQRRGLGRAVCLATIAAARTLGASHGLICAEGGNEAALRLYRSLGYEITTWTRPYRRPLRD